MPAATTLDARRKRWLLLPLAAALLAACGGGGGDGGSGGVGLCTTEARKEFVRSTFEGAGANPPGYLWYAINPNPDPAAYADEVGLFDALLSLGSGSIPADRWSNFESTESFNRFFGAGQTMGYGLSLAGLEVRGDRNAPLYVRLVDPGSSAEAQGLQRGDEVLSVGGFSAPELIDQVVAGSFTVLSPAAAGTQVVATLRRGTATFSVNLSASTYAVTPVSGASVLSTPQGRRMGYLFVRSMISQAHAPMVDAFQFFRNQGVSELVLDLRYNGGGLVETGRLLASHVAGAATQVYAGLRYNNLRTASNQDWMFAPQTNTLGLARVFVLAGERTCSASEQVINGLRGIGVNVVVVGDTTCGKPVGFNPTDDRCGTTYSVVTFDSVNARNEGRYYNGLLANCAVAENFQAAIGSSTDPLLNAARLVADGSACAPSSGASEKPQALRAAQRGHPGADGERIGLFR